MFEERIKSARILVVDDDEMNIRFLDRILAGIGIDGLVGTTKPQEAAARFLEVDPDLVLLDLHMPDMDGFEVMQKIVPLIPPGTYLPLVMLTGDTSPEVKAEALSSGAKDFIAKPFSATEVVLRIRNLLETRFLHVRLQRHNQNLELRVLERTAELEQARLEILDRLARAAEFRDDVTGEHTQRVGQLSGLIARTLGRPEDQVELITRAAPLHDIGKIGVPDGVLLKPGKLNPKEFDLMRAHTTIGASILSGSSVSLLQLAAAIALNHHEKWEGGGYPEGLSGESIPLAGRIVAVADVFDALTHERPYKVAFSVEEALREIESQKGRHFDPVVVEAFLEVLHSSRPIEILR